MSKYMPLWEHIGKCGADALTLTYEQIAEILGFDIDHSFLSFKKELAAYGYEAEKISMKDRTVQFAKTAPAERIIVTLSRRRDLKERAARWFASKWSVPEAAYLESIEQSFSAAVPEWYLCMEGEKIVAGMGVIENDFHDRKDLTPNVCAVYTNPDCRGRGIAGELLGFVCADMHARGIDTLYLLTDLTGFYERYGWEFLCMAQGDGETEPSRMYVHHADV